jgi:ferredoxin
MSYIIGNKCVSCIDTSCVNVCPVDCINGPLRMDDIGTDIKNATEEQKQGLQLYINPNNCINCGACVPECPVDAIYRNEEEAIPLGDEISIHKNYEFFGLKFDGKE